MTITLLDGMAFNLDASLLGMAFALSRVFYSVGKSADTGVCVGVCALGKLLLSAGKSSDSDKKKLDIPLLSSYI